MERQNKIDAQQWFYNAFIRANPPSLFVLARYQLAKERVSFNKDPEKYWNLMIDKAIKIRLAIGRNIINSKGIGTKKLHEDVRNAYEEPINS